MELAWLRLQHEQVDISLLAYTAHGTAQLWQNAHRFTGHGAAASYYHYSNHPFNLGHRLDAVIQ